LSTEQIDIQDWGLLDYNESLARQQALQQLRIAEEVPDTLILVQHPPVVTLGLRGGDDDLRFSQHQVVESGVDLHHINRGGFATAHEPGQLVAYPIVKLRKKDLRWYTQTFLQALAATLADFDLVSEFREGEPGLWVNGRKIASFGIAVKKWVSSHGIALNVHNSLATFDMIIPCGKPTEMVTSMQAELGQDVDLDVVSRNFVRHFCALFDYVESTWKKD
jgi:lipoate-protein ligase B